jgi:hypothetical protein
MTQVKAFKAVVIAITLIPLIAGGIGAFGGLEGLAALFGENRRVELAPGLRNHLRAICWMFLAIAPLLWWTLADLRARAQTFRIVVGFAVVAGFARITGMVVDGYPGPAAIIFTTMELAVLPLVLLWHTRLVRH